jgi:hypothetical protein
VELKIQIDAKDIEKFNDEDQRYFASVTVTDYSSYIEIPKYKHSPSLPTMIYLEKEVKQVNEKVDEFLYSHEYIDPYFVTEQFATEVSAEEQSIMDNRLEHLLGVQNWRKGLFNDMRGLNLLIETFEEEKMYLYQYIMGYVHMIL